MIIGIVNFYREATLRLPLQSANGQERQMEVILDTGFTCRSAHAAAPF